MDSASQSNPPPDAANTIAIYQSSSGTTEVRLEGETVWLRQEQLARLFGTSVDNVSLHLKNIYAEGELSQEATVEDYSVVRQEGNRIVTRSLKHYNLDAVISLGYRVNSAQATRFRQWATALLKEHLSRGYTLQKQRFAQNAKELEAALALVRKAAQGEELSADMGRGLVEIISRYTHTFLLLQQYDNGLLTQPQVQAGGVLPTVAEARHALKQLKHDLMTRQEATALFGQERDDGLAALLGNLNQSVFGQEAYPTVEEKAAHLLYFVVKNHPSISSRPHEMPT